MKQKMLPIAIVGLAGIFPGAGSADKFCSNIMEKTESIVDVPRHRWAAPPDAMVSAINRPDSAISGRAGLIENFTLDPSGFQLPPDLVAGLDPLHAMVLHAGRAAVQTCHISDAVRKRTGVILAAISLPTQSSSELAWRIFFGNGNGPITRQTACAASVVSTPAALLARAMGFCGGSFTLDAACASSLYAIKLACDRLNASACDMMIAGGVSRPDSLYTQVGFTQLQALSPSGRCSPFDAGADGLVVGEGTGIIVLKRLEDARKAGDDILGIITGTGWSNDIQGNLVAPASEGQIRAMLQAFETAGWKPGDIQHVECHGSGTPVGDLVELNTLKAVWQAHECQDIPCAIGSVKSNIGHLLTAAGAAGFIKTILAMGRHLLPPSINFIRPSETSPLTSTAFRVQTETEYWEPRPLAAEPGRHSRRAGISAFGFGGINAHLLVEEYLPELFLAQVPQAFPTPRKERLPEVAVVGMEVITPVSENLEAFRAAVAAGQPPVQAPPEARWRISLQQAAENGMDLPVSGCWMPDIITWPGEFHIAPNQIQDLLPQHLLMLKAAMGAVLDAGISPRPGNHDPERTRFGAAIGIDFDFEATDFYLRWKAWKADDPLKDALSQPLTANRTLGALGGIVASRVAREFKLGGPCFTVSAGAASGMKTIDIGVASIQTGETDTFLCGCVDMAGDIRQVLSDHPVRPYGSGKAIYPFSPESPGPVPSEGAGAVVLKSLDQALKDKDRIYAVITGTGSASSGETIWEPPYPGPDMTTAYRTSLERCLQASGADMSDIGLFQAHGSGHPGEDQCELQVLGSLFHSLGDAAGKTPMTLGTTMATQGDTKAASGLLSFISAALSVYSATLPPLPRSGNSSMVNDAGLQGPGSLETWHGNGLGPVKRQACAASISRDGTCAHIIMASHQPEPGELVPEEQATCVKRSVPEQKRAFPAQEPILLRTGRWMLEPWILEKISRITGPQSGGIPSGNTEPQRPSGTCDSMVKPPLAYPRSDAPGTLPSLPDSISGRMEETVEITGRAHCRFLDLAQETMAAMETQFAALTDLAARYIQAAGAIDPQPGSRTDAVQTEPVLFNRAQCLEFARGKAGTVLGPSFDIIDTYPVRVRLPDDPLMLVDRILSIQGEPLSLGQGSIVTQHDVKPGAWYLDGGRTPVSVSIEAGQADLFLCSWLGIDHAVQGKRRYRLLDAKVTFHRPLPVPGETIEYQIEIDRFLKQGDVYLFFFHYQGFINQELFISMRDGCAGFFTPEEVEKSGGIILKKDDLEPESAPVFVPPAPVTRTGFSDLAVEALRRGDLESAFGPEFAGKVLGRGLRLPGGRMHLVDRVVEFDPCGGRFGLGLISAEADIRPDHWFLTCHFIDDRVMPGTLMYDCCAHTLRMFTQRMGWVSPRDDLYYDIIPGLESDLKCRGPVTPETRKAGYRIEIKAMGYNPWPFVIADAHMFSDNHRIVLYKNMGMTIPGLSRSEIESIWTGVES